MNELWRHQWFSTDSTRGTTAGAKIGGVSFDRKPLHSNRSAQFRVNLEFNEDGIFSHTYYTTVQRELATERRKAANLIGILIKTKKRTRKWTTGHLNWPFRPHFFSLELFPINFTMWDFFYWLLTIEQMWLRWWMARNRTQPTINNTLHRRNVWMNVRRP